MDKNRLVNKRKFETLRNDWVTKANEIDIELTRELIIIASGLLALVALFIVNAPGVITDYEKVLIIISVIGLLISIAGGVKHFFVARDFHIEWATTYQEVIEVIHDQSKTEDQIANETWELQEKTTKKTNDLYQQIQVVAIGLASVFLAALVLLRLF